MVPNLPADKTLGAGLRLDPDASVTSPISASLGAHSQK